MKKISWSEKMTAPNCITAARIIGAFSLIFLTPLSAVYYVVYTLCGFSDILDGWIARKTNQLTDFGSNLDSVADLLFYSITIIRLLPVLWKLLPVWIWFIVGGIVFLRIISYITAAVKFHRFSSLHTRLNKLTGLSVFLLPYFLALPCAAAYCFIVCAVAVVSTVHELILHLLRKEYRFNKKALF